MRIVNIKSKYDVRYVQDYTDNNSASEQHHILIPFQSYYNSLPGFKFYRNCMKIRAYYEDGERGRFGHLKSRKQWFYGKIILNNDATTLRGVIISDHFVWILLFFAALASMYAAPIFLIVLFIFAYTDDRQHQKMLEELSCALGV